MLATKSLDIRKEVIGVAATPCKDSITRPEAGPWPRANNSKSSSWKHSKTWSEDGETGLEGLWWIGNTLFPTQQVTKTSTWYSEINISSPILARYLRIHAAGFHTEPPMINSK